MAKGSSNRSGAADALTKHGLRATRQRVALLDLLRGSSEHPTAQELHFELMSSDPNLSLKTVYETLDSFLRVGLARCVSECGSPHRFEANVASHDHAQCRGCGKLIDIPVAPDRPPRGVAKAPAGFEVDEIRIVVLGWCRTCKRKRTSTTRSRSKT